MEEAGLLDPLNSVHIFAIHHVFLPRINNSLMLFTNVWNQHPMSHQRNRSNQQLFITGLHNLMSNELVSEDFLKKVDDGYGIDPDGPLALELSFRKLIVQYQVYKQRHWHLLMFYQNLM